MLSLVSPWILNQNHGAVAWIQLRTSLPYTPTKAYFTALPKIYKEMWNRFVAHYTAMKNGVLYIKRESHPYGKDNFLQG